jgi:hypothetical protein
VRERDINVGHQDVVNTDNAFHHLDGAVNHESAWVVPGWGDTRVVTHDGPLVFMSASNSFLSKNVACIVKKGGLAGKCFVDGSCEQL